MSNHFSDLGKPLVREQSEQVIVFHPPLAQRWPEGLTNCNVMADFQGLVNILAEFHDRFHKPKYQGIFTVLSDPMLALLDTLCAEKPPEDVFVSTLSGSIQSQLQLLMLLKKGNYKSEAFYTFANRLVQALTTFVNSMQVGIRRYRTEGPSAAAAHQRLTHIEDVASLRAKILRLDCKPHQPTFNGVFRGALAKYTFISVIGLLLLAFGSGAGLQAGLGALFSEGITVGNGLDVSWFMPAVLFAVGLFLVNIAFFRSRRKSWAEYDAMLVTYNKKRSLSLHAKNGYVTMCDES